MTAETEEGQEATRIPERQKAFFKEITRGQLHPKKSIAELFKALPSNCIFDPPSPLTAKAGDVGAYCLKRVYVWLPHVRYNQGYPIDTWTCPKCNTHKAMKTDKWSPTTAKLYDSDDIAYVLTYDYKCKSCSSVTKGTEKTLLPPLLRDGKSLTFSSVLFKASSVHYRYAIPHDAQEWHVEATLRCHQGVVVADWSLSYRR